MKQAINQALKVLHEGGILLYPTDTIWGLGCDATNAEAVEKIIDLKGRNTDKSFIVLLDSEVKLASYVREVPEVAYDLIEYAENPLTIIFSDAKNLAENVVNKDGSIAIRIVRHAFCNQLIQRFRKPIVSTSANLSGHPSPLDFEAISSAISSGVDYIVPREWEESGSKKPSTIVKLGPSGQFEFIRR